MPDVAALVHELEHGTAAARAEAAEHLAQLGENAQAASIPLIRATASDDEAVREWATSALEDLGPPSREDLQALVTLLEQPALDPAYWAATLLGRLHAEAGDAVGALAKALSHPEMAVRERAAWALGEIGPAALGAKAELEQAAQASPPRLTKLARAALDNLKS